MIALEPRSRSSRPSDPSDRRLPPPIRVRRLLAPFLGATLSAMLSTDPARAQSIRADLAYPNRQVSAAVVSGSTLYIGGSFDHVGFTTGNAVPIDAATGQVQPFPIVDGEVRAVAPDGAGGWYIGGSFQTVGGLPRNRIARILADNTVSGWNPNTNDGVFDIYAITVSGSIVYVGGEITNIGGQARNNIAALEAATGNATVWNPSANGRVSTLVVNGTLVYAGGSFTSIGSQPRNQIAALDAATGLATGWNPNVATSLNTSVNAILVSGSTIYAGGRFTDVGGQARSNLAALDASSGIPTSWNPGADAVIQTLAVSGTTIYAGGGFKNIGGQPRNGIAALDAATGMATSWNPNATYSPSASAAVYALVVSGSTVYAGGFFLSIGGQARDNLAALNIVSGNATAWNPTAEQNVLALAVNGSTVFAGGLQDDGQ